MHGQRQPIPQEESWSPTPEGDPGLLAATDAVLASLAQMRSGRVAPEWSLDETREQVSAIDLSQAVGLEAATREAHELMQRGDLTSSSARCFGYFNPTAAWPAVVADLLVAARNPQICVVSHAPASATMERQVIAFFLRCLGFPADGVGNFTSGGSEANATAVLVALVRGNARFADEGLYAYDGRPSLYASADSHLAWIKIARAAGLGRSAVRLVPTTGDGRMDPEALRSMIAGDRQAGWNPVMIAATAGTTNAGAIDPLAVCRRIADDEDVHLHVDAAWAGALIVDPERRAYLAGIEQADSVTIDAHKWLSVPMGAGMVFVRDRSAVRDAFAVQTGYMPAGDGEGRLHHDESMVATVPWSALVDDAPRHRPRVLRSHVRPPLRAGQTIARSTSRTRLDGAQRERTAGRLVRRRENGPVVSHSGRRTRGGRPYLARVRRLRGTYPTARVHDELPDYDGRSGAAARSIGCGARSIESLRVAPSPPIHPPELQPKW